MPSWLSFYRKQMLKRYIIQESGMVFHGTLLTAKEFLWFNRIAAFALGQHAETLRQELVINVLEDA